MTITELPKPETLTREQFLDNMVAYYSEDPLHRRAKVSEHTCAYRADDGRKCAIGRWIPDNLYDPCIERVAVRDEFVFGILPSHLKSLGDDFLNAVQQLHDIDGYWDSDGLTFSGKQFMDRIKTAYL